jgi:multicomponent Na+:H+ antiporter subunit D
MTEILVFTFIGFWILRKKLAGDPKIALDTDWFYRKSAPFTREVFVRRVDAVYGWAENSVLTLANLFSRWFRNPMLWLNPFTDKENEAESYSPPMEIVMSFILLSFVVIALYYIL